MAYNTDLGNQIRNLMQDIPLVEEKVMFGGLCFMVDEKMCIGVVKDRLMCRLAPERANELCEINGVEPLDFTGKRMKGFLYVDAASLQKPNDLLFWIQECVAFNPLATKSKPAKKKGN